MPSRRQFLSLFSLSLGATMLMPWGAGANNAPTIVDGGGRKILVPAEVKRVFAAGPPAAVLLLAVAPEKLLGWPIAPRKEARPLLPDTVANLPEVGRFAGRGSPSSPESVAALKPDLILDTGAADATHISMAEQVQRQTGIPYAVIDGRFIDTPSILRQAGILTGNQDRAEKLARYAEALMAETMQKVAQVPDAKRPRVYFARSATGLETGLKGSIHTEIIEYLGARNAAGDAAGPGLSAVSMEQVLSWDPDIIIVESENFAQSDATPDAFLKQGVKRDAWQSLRAVREGRVYVAPASPFGWVDGPPGINRLVGLPWLAAKFYPDLFQDDLRGRVREFHQLFYGVALSDAQLDTLIGPDGRR